MDNVVFTEAFTMNRQKWDTVVVFLIKNGSLLIWLNYMFGIILFFSKPDYFDSKALLVITMYKAYVDIPLS